MLTDVLARVPLKRPLTAGSGTRSLGVGLAAAFRLNRRPD